LKRILVRATLAVALLYQKIILEGLVPWLLILAISPIVCGTPPIVKLIVEEGQRSAQEGLSEEELAIFDLLALNITLSEEEHSQVKALARSILEKLQPVFNVIDWHKKPLTLGRAYTTIEDELLKLPEAHEYEQRRNALFLYILEHYKNDGSISVA
jgi:Domain of unknown function (DUF3387)